LFRRYFSYIHIKVVALNMGHTLQGSLIILYINNIDTDYAYPSFKTLKRSTVSLSSSAPLLSIFAPAASSSTVEAFC
jgi:hypothetical protein